jgi:Inner membrane protein YgaP-like, transmembrane domain
MKNTRKIHDGIVGVVIIIGVALGSYANPSWLWLPGIIGALMIQSAFTGFCPIYFLLAKCGLKE